MNEGGYISKLCDLKKHVLRRSQEVAWMDGWLLYVTITYSFQHMVHVTRSLIITRISFGDSL